MGHSRPNYNSAVSTFCNALFLLCFHNLRREKVSDVNVMEKVVLLLFGEYKLMACFSLGFAFFMDVCSALAGLFIYGIRPRKKKIVYHVKNIKILKKQGLSNKISGS
jgi:hypothetical protein